MLHFGELTEKQEFAMFQLKREGGKRYVLTWYHKIPGNAFLDKDEEAIADSNLYEDVLNAMHKHYKKLLDSDPSRIMDFESEEYYEITDFLSEDRYNMDHVRIDVKDLNKLAYMLQFFDIGKKTTKHTTKTAADTEPQDEA